MASVHFSFNVSFACIHDSEDSRAFLGASYRSLDSKVTDLRRLCGLTMIQDEKSAKLQFHSIFGGAKLNTNKPESDKRESGV